MRKNIGSAIRDAMSERFCGERPGPHRHYWGGMLYFDERAITLFRLYTVFWLTDEVRTECDEAARMGHVIRVAAIRKVEGMIP